MKRIVILAPVVLAALSAVGVAGEDNTQPAHSVDFENDIIPVFTKNGCNAGACHGAAIGRGGFKLSLYGGDPASDYDAIVRQLEGRRVNLSKPDESLIVLKPAEYVEHGGGTVFDYDSESAQLLIDWIKQGAVNRSQRSLKSVEISPKKHVAKSLGELVALRAIAHYSDGTARDVTKWTIFKAEDSSAVEINDSLSPLGQRTSNESSLSAFGERTSSESSLSPAAGERVGVRGQQFAKALRRGRHIVVARYLNEVVPIEIVVPLTDTQVDLSAEPRNNFIDEEILESLATLGLPPAPIVDHATFLRRISLDLTGRLPSAEDVKSFLAVEPPHPNPLPHEARGRGGRSESEGKSKSEGRSESEGKSRRDLLVDELLQSDEFNEYWTLQLAKLLRIRPLGPDRQGALTYHQWLADQIRDDASYKQLARTVIMATGDSHEYGPANFYRTVAGPREQAEFMSELFMGSRLRCANCHNHPLDRWTQDDYHGLAAIFAKVDVGQVVKEKPRGEVIHPRTVEPAIGRIPGEYFLADDAADGRQQLADWLTDSTNPYFAKAIVNRLWKRMMGRGLVEPADDFRATNPATHPALLDKLADDFVANGYSLRHTLRLIASSATYARSANASEQNKDDDRFYSHAARRPLEPEVLADAISDVLGVASKYGDEPEGTRAVALVDPKTQSLTLDILGRCDREQSCESSPAAIGGLPQKLHLLNGALLNARIAADGSRLHNLIASGKQPMQIVGEFYLAALNRHPTDQEQQHWKEKLNSVTSADDQRAFLEDFVWGLMTCNEFITNH